MSTLMRHHCYTVSKIDVACCNCNFKFLFKKSLKRVRAIQIQFEFGSVTLVLKENGKQESTQRKTSQSKGGKHQKTQPTNGAVTGIWTRATLVGGECSHHCSTLAPRGLPWDYAGQKGIVFEELTADVRVRLNLALHWTLLSFRLMTIAASK